MSKVNKGGFWYENTGGNESVHWLTPPELVKRLGHFDLDPCGCPEMPWELADRVYYLPKHDGLKEEWKGRVFCNPPYGNHIKEWAKRMAQHQNGILLIFSRVETMVWQDYVWPFASAVLFPYGRVCFRYPDGSKPNSGNAPSALIAYGADNVKALRSCKIAGHLVCGAETMTGDKASSF